MNKQLQQRIGELLGKDYFKLEFGCDVIVEGIANDNPGCQYDVVIDHRIKDNCVNCGYFGYVPLEALEILGTEPTLQDVLLAIDDKNYCIDCRGNFGKTLYVDSGLPVMKYDLTKSLFNQTDEVKQQLLELMS